MDVAVNNVAAQGEDGEEYLQLLDGQALRPTLSELLNELSVFVLQTFFHTPILFLTYCEQAP